MPADKKERRPRGGAAFPVPPTALGGDCGRVGVVGYAVPRLRPLLRARLSMRATISGAIWLRSLASV